MLKYVAIGVAIALAAPRLMPGLFGSQAAGQTPTLPTVNVGGTPVILQPADLVNMTPGAMASVGSTTAASV